MPDWLGKKIGQVRIEKLLAQGATAEVYLGTHLTLERQVAIKLLHSYIQEEPILLDRFHREAKVVARLRHPNIVQVYDFDTADGQPYLVMEYLKGPTLATYLRHLHQRKKRVAPDQIARLLKSIASALDYAHGQGVIHRDIKPGNIVLHNKTDEVPLDQPLADDVEPIITDFGLVRVMNAASQTASGIVSGTPAYMSPEQALGEEIDHRTDVYSLGAVVYEMLAGHLPFEADNTVTVLHMHIHTMPPPIPGIPANVQAVVDRALQKSPDDRYRTSGEMARDFYRSVDITAPAERRREPYLVSPVTIEEPIDYSNSGPATPAPIVSEPKPTQKLEPKLGIPEATEPVPISVPTPGPEPQRTPASSEKPGPKPTRIWLWIGLGLFSLVFMSILVVGALRFLSAGPLVPKATQAVGPVIPNTGTSPLPSITANLPNATNMVKVDAGMYEVGTSIFTDEFHIAPQKIQLNGFWIDQYQTTNDEYQRYMVATGAPAPIIWPGEAKHPVRGVTWDQAAAYCSWARKRLPDEAEWEAAGRGPGPDPQLYPWGTEATAGGAALTLPDEDTYEVGSQSFNISPFKVYDMVGNVWEWVGQPYASVQKGYKVLHGGRYGNPQDLAYRLVVPPDDNIIRYAGFRCAAQEVTEN